ncbi:angiopoietin-2a [Carassius carassius]|uniref:angiopoietin-2a n=1 Tax=Carassius carassius TaxID=217509 RepID=UPI00286894D9|nr:angiopoietin-2a [Carassius carassius]
MLNAGILLLLSYCLSVGQAFTANSDTTGKKQYQIQNGPCTYTFLLPEPQDCEGPSSTYTNQVQRDDLVDYDSSIQRLEQLENIMENNTQWLQKLENYIQENLKQDMAQIQNNVVQNHTVTMIKIGTSLLSQTAEQTRKITTVEAQVINQTTRLERQLLENSISTSKLEKEILQQIKEINKLNEKNSVLEKRVEKIEGKRNTELEDLKEEKEQLKKLVEKQTNIMKEMEQQLIQTSSDNSAMKQQQQELTNTVNNLIHTISVGSNSMMQDNPDQYNDCAAVFSVGNKESGVFTLTIPDTKQQFKAYCDMQTDGGGWTVIQKRFNGLVDFHQTWKNYTLGFGDILGEHWLGNEIISKLTQEKQYVLRIDLMDWEGNAAFSKYEQFSLDGEKQNYRIHLNGYSGTAGRTSSMGQPGSDFSTKDIDNDKCVCKCSQMLSGGWWFDACGPSNLNGVYYQQGQNTNRFNGIKWYYWKGSAYSLKATTMMIRPSNF